MVTASHNPKADNGFKIYWSNTAQIIPPIDKEIYSRILQNQTPWTTYGTSLAQSSLPQHWGCFACAQMYRSVPWPAPPKRVFASGTSKCSFTTSLPSQDCFMCAWLAMTNSLPNPNVCDDPNPKYPSEPWRQHPVQAHQGCSNPSQGGQGPNSCGHRPKNLKSNGDGDGG